EEGVFLRREAEQDLINEYAELFQQLKASQAFVDFQALATRAKDVASHDVLGTVVQERLKRFRIEGEKEARSGIELVQINAEIKTDQDKAPVSIYLLPSGDICTYYSGFGPTSNSMEMGFGHGGEAVCRALCDMGIDCDVLIGAVHQWVENTTEKISEETQALEERARILRRFLHPQGDLYEVGCFLEKVAAHIIQERIPHISFYQSEDQKRIASEIVNSGSKQTKQRKNPAEAERILTGDHFVCMQILVSLLSENRVNVTMEEPSRGTARAPVMLLKYQGQSMPQRLVLHGNGAFDIVNLPQ
ncbi:MAG: hypothetical protein KDD55_13885, partial [Bdellovibrionales bacterium]|nr:hypothetical protein [Bdellovibrionales bacterium]